MESQTFYFVSSDEISKNMEVVVHDPFFNSQNTEGNVVPELNSVAAESVDVEETESKGEIENTSVEIGSSTFCTICKKKYSHQRNLRRHQAKIHNMHNPEKKVRRNGTLIKCIECNIIFNHLRELRHHLEVIHNMSMHLEQLQFKNMDEFHKWKRETERKTMCSYTCRYKVSVSNSKKTHSFSCHRSGTYAPKVQGPRKRMLKTQGTCKLGIVCTSTILACEDQNEVNVTYCPCHYGHGNKASTQEQIASAFEGTSSEQISEEGQDIIYGGDIVQYDILKKKDFRYINIAYDTTDYNSDLNEIDGLEHWIEVYSQLENSPILLYVQGTKENEGEFILVIMTEYQKHILVSSPKTVICIDAVHRRKGGRFYLTVVFVLDENGLGFPVAFCVSKVCEKGVIVAFLECMKEAVGVLEFDYLMSDNDPCFIEAWIKVMGDNVKWLWSTWYVDEKWKRQLRIFKGMTEKRSEVYRMMRKLLECENESTFESMYTDFILNLYSNPQTKDIGGFIKQHYGLTPENWAFCFRKDIELSTNAHFEILHDIFRYCSSLGRKKRIDKFVYVIMKVVRDKIIERLDNIDTEKHVIALHNIAWCHEKGMKIPARATSVLSEKEWIVKSTDGNECFFVALDNASCPERCKLVCDSCDVCVHMYTCTCSDNLINANLCDHIHAIAWNYFSPHFDVPDENSELDENFKEQVELLHKALKRTHDVYKTIKSKKCKLKKDSLNSILSYLDACVNICIGKNEVNNVVNIMPQSVNILNPIVNNQSNMGINGMITPTINIVNNNHQSNMGINGIVNPTINIVPSAPPSVPLLFFVPNNNG